MLFEDIFWRCLIAIEIALVTAKSVAKHRFLCYIDCFGIQDSRNVMRKFVGGFVREKFYQILLDEWLGVCLFDYMAADSNC